MAHSLRDQHLHIGTWLGIGAPVIAELAAECGFDWLLFDLEHGCGTDAALLPQLHAIRGTKAATIVRVGAPHPDLVLRVLDWGANGLMFPHIASAAEAEVCVRAAHYPPRGHRGMSRSARAYGYGLRPPGAPGTIPAPLIMAQIETIEGVENADAIAKVDGVDVLFVGPADLQFDLCARPDKSSRDYDACLKHVAGAAKSAGKQSGILIRNPAEIQLHLDLGYTVVALESDLAMLRKGWQQVLSAARQ